MKRRLLPQVLDGVDQDDCNDTPETWTNLVADKVRAARRRLARLAVVIPMALVAACVPASSRIEAPAAPDTSGVLRLVGRFSSAHACPISESLALTSAHVTDLRPFDRGMPAFP